MKRGFKAEAERIATETRSELRLPAREKLDPIHLAQHLEIPVLTLTEVARGITNGSFSRYFSLVDPESFSAITIFRGYRRFIVHNEHHHPNRQSSNLAHEISHIILEHEATPVISSDGQRYWNPEVEDEANWLGAALLVPREGLLDLAKAEWTIPEIATQYGVSESLCRWRITQTGVAKQLERWRQWKH